MTKQLAQRNLQTVQIGDVTVVTFPDRYLLEETAIQSIGDQLAALVKLRRPPQILLNLAGVEKLSTLLLGHILALHRKVQARGGRLALCSIEPTVADIFEIFKLGDLMPVYTEEQEALQAL